MDLAIIGAGISGMALAAFQTQGTDLTVFEASEGVGGLTGGALKEGALQQWGANGFIDNEPAMDLLLQKLNLESIPAMPGARYLLKDQSVVALPAKPPGIFTSPLLSWRAKIRLLLEPFKSTLPHEQSVTDYLSHRLGREAALRFGDPMVAGVWAGDASELSMQAAFPRLVEAAESHGSLFKALRAAKKHPSKAPGLRSFEGGMGEITEAIRIQLGERLHLQEPVEKIRPTQAGWTLDTTQGQYESQRIVLALNAPTTASLIEPLLPETAALIRSIPQAPVAVVHSVFSREDWNPPEGFGLLCPSEENMRSLGVLFSSSTFPSHAPENQLLLRSILGGRRQPSHAEADPQRIQQWALDDIKNFFPGCPEPLWQTCYKPAAGIPQYTLGHREKIQEIRKQIRSLQGIEIIGNWLEGVAVKDCVRVAHACAGRLQV